MASLSSQSQEAIAAIDEELDSILHKKKKDSKTDESATDEEDEGCQT